MSMFYLNCGFHNLTQSNDREILRKSDFLKTEPYLHFRGNTMIKEVVRPKRSSAIADLFEFPKCRLNIVINIDLNVLLFFREQQLHLYPWSASYTGFELTTYCYTYMYAVCPCRGAVFYIVLSQKQARHSISCQRDSRPSDHTHRCPLTTYS